MKQLSKSLAINKATIANLTGSEMSRFKGGAPESVYFCETDTEYTNASPCDTDPVTIGQECQTNICISAETNCEVDTCLIDPPLTETEGGVCETTC